MICKEMFAVVFLVLTGCLSAMALHSGNWPKNINKRNVGVCGSSPQPTTVPVDEAKLIPLSEFNNMVDGKNFKNAVSAKAAPGLLSPKTLRFTKDANSSDYTMTTIEYNQQNSSCSQPQDITLEHIPPKSRAVGDKAVFKQKIDGDDRLVAIFSTCSDIIWQMNCQSPFVKLFECPLRDTVLDLFLASNLDLSRVPLEEMLESLKNVTGVKMGMKGLYWRFDGDNSPCQI